MQIHACTQSALLFPEGSYPQASTLCVWHCCCIVTLYFSLGKTILFPWCLCFILANSQFCSLLPLTPALCIAQVHFHWSTGATGPQPLPWQHREHPDRAWRFGRTDPLPGKVPSSPLLQKQAANGSKDSRYQHEEPFHFLYSLFHLYVNPSGMLARDTLTS